MKYILNKDGQIRLSQIGLGTGRFGTLIEESLAFEMLDLFCRSGGTLLDTARNYYEWIENGHGKSEECIGKWVEERRYRDRVQIATKGGVSNRGNEWKIDLSKNALLEELDRSLCALRTNYIDIYFLHRDEPQRSVEEIVETMQQLAEVGKIRMLGVANWSVDRVRTANDYAKRCGLRDIELVQTWWSIAQYTKAMWNDDNTTHMDRKMYHYLLDHHMIGVAYTSQCKGFFQKASRIGINALPSKLRVRIETPDNTRILHYLEQYSRENGVEMTDLVNSYITSNPLHGIALVSCSSTEQLNDILCHCDYEMPMKVIEEIDRMKYERS